jgi:hypothetical protein
MKKHLPLKELERNMRDHMLRDKVYTLKELYALYILRMSVDQRIRSYARMSIGSLEKRAREWSGPGMWMVRNNGEDEMVYFKRVVHRSPISAAELNKKANEIINCVAGRIPSWLKWQ